jgi:hypothetical protein
MGYHALWFENAALDRMRALSTHGWPSIDCDFAMPNTSSQEAYFSIGWPSADGVAGIDKVFLVVRCAHAGPQPWPGRRFSACSSC